MDDPNISELTNEQMFAYQPVDGFLGSSRKRSCFAAVDGETGETQRNDDILDYLGPILSPGKAEAVSRPKEVDENGEEVKTLREQSLGKRCVSVVSGRC